MHDSRVDLSEESEVVYWDKGYFGVEIRGISAAMRSAVRGSSPGYLGQAEEPAYQSEAGAGGETVRRDQADVRLGARSGDDVAQGSCEDVVRVFLLQPGSAGHAGGEVVAWALDVSRERAVEWWRDG